MNGKQGNPGKLVSPETSNFCSSDLLAPPTNKVKANTEVNHGINELLIN